ncbi:hypothetical protein VP1G_11436 [Cytospora mali]|uniref:Uncharacterized protein n=1 Tax=Cytospora mali TaxID=578113 RepID=A0A194VFG3_CYTMA|nr:hypothetical protein VP1G_11436 [Valsa mali var. pyri (nom. inval.)]
MAVMPLLPMAGESQNGTSAAVYRDMTWFALSPWLAATQNSYTNSFAYMEYASDSMSPVSLDALLQHIE